MTGETGAPTDLPVGHNYMDTNYMGDCVTVIVLWGRVGGPGNPYPNVRGWHGLGGILAIDMDQLFNGVPNPNNPANVDDPIVLVFTSYATGSLDYLNRLIDEMIRGRFLANPISITVHNGRGRYHVDRNGIVGEEEAPTQNNQGANQTSCCTLQ